MKRLLIVCAAASLLAVPLLRTCVSAHWPTAAIVKVTYLVDGKQVGGGIYTGADGGAHSDPLQYWSLISSRPQFVPEDVQIKPDKEGGKTATLQGKILISLDIRNSINMGLLKFKQLQLVRDDAQSQKWYVPASEFKRIRALVEKDLADTVTVKYVRDYDTLLQCTYQVPPQAIAQDYWKLLATEPAIINRGKLSPDQPEGKTTTLQGDIKIELSPRPYVKLPANASYAGQLEIDTLKLVRDNASQQYWHVAQDELKRILSLTK